MQAVFRRAWLGERTWADILAASAQLRGNAYERFPYSLPTKTTEEGNAETVFTAGQVGAPVIAGGDVASRYSEEASVELRTPHEADVEHIDVHVRL